jgi:chromosomal replication initiator protein
MMDRIWGQACAELERSVGPNNYNHWIKPLRLTGIDEGAALFASPTRFISDWVSRHFANDIMAVLNRAGAPVERLRFEIGHAAVRPRPSDRNGWWRCHRGAHHPYGPRADLGAPLDRVMFLGISLSANRTNWPMPPRAVWPRAVLSASTRCSFMAAWVWARRT